MNNVRLLLLCGATLVVTFFATISLHADPGVTNGSPARAAVGTRQLSEEEIHRRIQHFSPEWTGVWSQTVSCQILGPNGNPTRLVPITDFGDPAYYFFYTSDFVFADQVRFIALPISAGSPLNAIIQDFQFASPEDSNITTPFGIPGWALDLTSGPWLLVVIKDQSEAGQCGFFVVPD